jgi:hypothetical protein
LFFFPLANWQGFRSASYWALSRGLAGDEAPAAQQQQLRARFVPREPRHLKKSLLFILIFHEVCFFSTQKLIKLFFSTFQTHFISLERFRKLLHYSE